MPVTRRRIASALATAIGLALVASSCASGGGAAVGSRSSPSGGEQVGAAPSPTGPSGQGGAGGGAASTPAAVPEILDFEAPLVGGGTLAGAELAGAPVAVWFWAPW